MRKIWLLLAVILWVSNKSISQPCATDAYLQQLLYERPHLHSQQAQIEHVTQQWITNHSQQLSGRTLITIPVVFHVVWKNAVENISDAQILSQLEVLNADFQAMNAEIANVPAIFKSAIADTEIEFCLAQSDPAGNTTNGITRTQTNIDQIGVKFTDGKRAICYTDLGGQDAWDTDHYLNIWIGKSTPTFIGEASYPGIAPPAEDGIRMDYAHIGTTGNVQAPYNKGRTLTHEIGHYLNVQHPWGVGLDNPDCSKDDGVTDTPPQFSTFQNECPVHPQVFCGTASMFMNFMNYTDDACMAMFTKGQKARMLATLNGPRASLLESTGCQTGVSNDLDFIEQDILIFNNPVSDAIRLEWNTHVNYNFDVLLINSQGQLLFTDHWHTSNFYTKDVTNLPAGLYFLVLQNENTIYTKKLIISH